MNTCIVKNTPISTPLYDFLNHISEKLKLNIYNKFKAYENHGDIYRCKHLKVLNSKIWKYNGLIYKLRVDNGKESARILFTKKQDGEIIIMHGFLKSTQKTPKKDAYQAIMIYQMLDEMSKITWDIEE